MTPGDPHLERDLRWMRWEPVLKRVCLLACLLAIVLIVYVIFL